MGKKDNSHLKLKLDIRRKMLSEIFNPSIYESCAGDGVIKNYLYKDYDVVDSTDLKTTNGSAIHCDAHNFLRAVDLSMYNFFDLDFYGSCRKAVWIISQRRIPTETIAIIGTDGGYGGPQRLPKAGRSNSAQSVDAAKLNPEAPGKYIARDGEYLVARLLKSWFEKWDLKKYITARGGDSQAMLYFGALLTPGEFHSSVAFTAD